MDIDCPVCGYVIHDNIGFCANCDESENVPFGGDKPHWFNDAEYSGDVARDPLAFFNSKTAAQDWWITYDKEQSDLVDGEVYRAFTTIPSYDNQNIEICIGHLHLMIGPLKDFNYEECNGPYFKWPTTQDDIILFVGEIEVEPSFRKAYGTGITKNFIDIIRNKNLPTYALIMNQKLEQKSLNFLASSITSIDIWEKDADYGMTDFAPSEPGNPTDNLKQNLDPLYNGETVGRDDTSDLLKLLTDHIHENFFPKKKPLFHDDRSHSELLNDPNVNTYYSSEKSKLTSTHIKSIHPSARKLLNRFWKNHPDLRKGCTTKYGYDPIDQEADYWKYGLAEPEHKMILEDVYKNDGIFSPELAKRWMQGELAAAKRESKITIVSDIAKNFTNLIYPQAEQWSGPLYHLAPTQERARIQSYGIYPSKPAISEHWPKDPNLLIKNQPEGVYVIKDYDFIGKYKMRSMYLGKAMDIWQIDWNGPIVPDLILNAYSAYYIPTDSPIPATLYMPYEDHNDSSNEEIDETTRRIRDADIPSDYVDQYGVGQLTSSANCQCGSNEFAMVDNQKICRHCLSPWAYQEKDFTNPHSEMQRQQYTINTVGSEYYDPMRDQFQIPVEAIIENSVKQRKCPNCKNYTLVNRGDFLACEQCPFEYDLTKQASGVPDNDSGSRYIHIDREQLGDNSKNQHLYQLLHDMCKKCGEHAAGLTGMCWRCNDESKNITASIKIYSDISQNDISDANTYQTDLHTFTDDTLADLRIRDKEPTNDVLSQTDHEGNVCFIYSDGVIHWGTSIDKIISQKLNHRMDTYTHPVLSGKLNVNSKEVTFDTISELNQTESLKGSFSAALKREFNTSFPDIYYPNDDQLHSDEEIYRVKY